VRLPRQQQMQALLRRLEFLDGGALINLDGRKRVIMESKDFVAAYELSCLDGVVNAHREIIAYGQKERIDGVDPSVSSNE